MSTDAPIKRRKFTLITLIASLMLNAFLIGFWWGNFDPPASPRGNAVSINRFIQQLPAKDRQLIMQVFASKRPIFQHLRRELKQINLKLAELTQQPILDLKMIEQMMQQVRLLNGQIQENFHLMNLEILPSLSPEARKKLAEAQRWDLSTILQQR